MAGWALWKTKVNTHRVTDAQHDQRWMEENVDGSQVSTVDLALVTREIGEMVEYLSFYVEK